MKVTSNALLKPVTDKISGVYNSNKTACIIIVASIVALIGIYLIYQRNDQTQLDVNQLPDTLKKKWNNP